MNFLVEDFREQRFLNYEVPVLNAKSMGVIKYELWMRKSALRKKDGVCNAMKRCRGVGGRIFRKEMKSTTKWLNINKE